MSWDSEQDGEASTNAKRLSAMIDSLHDASVDDFLFVRRGSVSPEKGGSPGRRVASPSRVRAAKRESQASEYAGSIHEGQPVSYVVAKNAVTDVRCEPKLPPLPPKDERGRPLGLGIRAGSEEELAFPRGESASPASLRLVPSQQLLGEAPAVRASAVGATTPNRYSLPSEVSPPHILGREPDVVKGGVHPGRPIVLDSDEDEGSRPRIKTEEDVSAPFHYRARDDASDEAMQPHPAIFSSTGSLRQDSGDTESLQSSVIPVLKTSVMERQKSGKRPDRSSVSEFQPVIPARNKNRPKSAVFIQQGLENIQRQLEREMIGAGTPPDAPYGHSRDTSVSTATKSDSYFSATELNESNNVNDKSFGEETLRNVDTVDGIGALSSDTPTDSEDNHYLSRPLPTLPNRETSVNTLTRTALSDEVFNTSPLVIPSNLPTKAEKAEADEEQWEDEYKFVDGIEEELTKLSMNGKSKDTKVPSQSKVAEGSTSLQSKPKSSPAKNKKRKDVRSFDIDTISQLLNATKGTLIGSEFANLGIRTEEKRALERLVDSLSRLTADMVVDPDRYTEGLRRLEKATRALDGF
ncbi:AaceriAER196Wp [[Ashbya] aceris (nom. inval.)]|nr:AaceriAER196Wp [[Ashbya] aceris (nom. inval.)]